jgi:NAD-dependent deacetylase
MIEVEISERLTEILRNPRARVVVSTGAGVSAESGVPTFRSAGGLWKTYKAETLATPEAFADNPEVVWEWYEFRRAKIREVSPNPGHYELARWERYFPNLVLITQNIDGLHHRAGSSQPIELHGNIMMSKCFSCGRSAGDVGLGKDGKIPHCACGGLLRPSVVWFGEAMPQRELQQAWEAAQSADVFLSVGTSGVVQPAASLAAVAQEAGAFLVEINPEATEVSYMFDEALRHPSGVALPAIGERIGIARE